MTADRNARIEERAYHLWLEEGRPHGRHDEHWHRAERELIEEEASRRAGAPVTASPDGAEAIGASEASVERAAPLRTKNGQDPIAAEPADVSRSRGKSQAPDHPKADRPIAKPRARSSRAVAVETAAGSGSRSSRRPAAKPAE
ncbi:MAG TPA: DUF2934 domain-containing protein [Stellaceae bacterium]|nr:DUF2934 domain-containing protein [Stellaceae bacterium]